MPWPAWSSLPSPKRLLRTSRRITSGLALTFTAVALVALAGTSAWWPTGGDEDDGGGAAVGLQAGGTSVCGTLAEAQQGAVAIVTSGRQVTVPLERLTALRPVDGC